MRRSRFSEEQIVTILKESEAGAATGDLCRRHGISCTSCSAVNALPHLGSL